MPKLLMHVLTRQNVITEASNGIATRGGRNSACSRDHEIIADKGRVGDDDKGETLESRAILELVGQSMLQQGAMLHLMEGNATLEDERN